MLLTAVESFGADLGSKASANNGALLSLAVDPELYRKLSSVVNKTVRRMQRFLERERVYEIEARLMDTVIPGVPMLGH
ncbi:hypothetical protein WN48_00903 [Eufriesea mexicana]|uniref:Uncharacterized protein n=1 Tax=Eufriesea mexicana TaxID=516756 RepID=A0A310S582_9HYME|nr:hypothetical protein WN48_00903 [Eufriesea mexicana]